MQLLEGMVYPLGRLRYRGRSFHFTVPGGLDSEVIHMDGGPNPWPLLFHLPQGRDRVQRKFKSGVRGSRNDAGIRPDGFTNNVIVIKDDASPAISAERDRQNIEGVPQSLRGIR